MESADVAARWLIYCERNRRWWGAWVVAIRVLVVTAAAWGKLVGAVASVEIIVAVVTIESIVVHSAIEGVVFSAAGKRIIALVTV